MAPATQSSGYRAPLCRSLVAAAMPADECRRLVEGYAHLLDERRRIEAILAELPTSFAEVRRALNTLIEVLGA